MRGIAYAKKNKVPTTLLIHHLLATEWRHNTTISLLKKETEKETLGTKHH
jgi:hypothetical protein